MPRAIVIGAGHNGLVAAILLARGGIDVTVLEEKHGVGGAARTEYPFAKAPRLATSTGAYLLGLMPPELLTGLGARLSLFRRDPHYFLPTLDRRYLLIGSDKAALHRQFREFFTEDDWHASRALALEIAQIRDDIAPSWLEEPCPAEETAERYVRPVLRRVFLDLVSRPVEEYLDRFGFKSELVVAMYAVTDGFSGLHAGFGMPGTGMNFLVHNMCRLPGADGTWMIVKGGMGAVSQELARLATGAGARIRTGVGVDRVRLQGGRVVGVTMSDGEELDADIVVSNADPFRTRDLVGADRFPDDFNTKLDGFRRSGTTLKVNLALDRLPRFSCLPDDRGQHGATVHLLPPGPGVIDHLRRSFAQAEAGELPEFPGIEWYTHTRVDPSMQDEAGPAQRGVLRPVGSAYARTQQLGVRGSALRRPSDRPRRPVCAGLSRERGGRVPADACRHRIALRYDRRPHPSRGQQLRVRSADAVRHADRGVVCVRRGLPSGRVGDWGRRPQRRAARVAGSGSRFGPGSWWQRIATGVASPWQLRKITAAARTSKEHTCAIHAGGF